MVQVAEPVLTSRYVEYSVPPAPSPPPNRRRRCLLVHRLPVDCGVCIGVVAVVGGADVGVAAGRVGVTAARCEVVGVAKRVAVTEDVTVRVAGAKFGPELAAVAEVNDVTEGVTDTDFGPAAVADDVQAAKDSAHNAAPAAAMHRRC